MKTRIYLETKPWADQTDIYIVSEDNTGKRIVARPVDLVFEPVPEGMRVDPTLRFAGPIARDFLPALTNALAEAGYRQESNDAGELKATKAHLQDMRTLALRASERGEK